MRCVIIVPALIALAHAKKLTASDADEAPDILANKLAHRLLHRAYEHIENQDDTMLRKPGHLVTRPCMSLRSAPCMQPWAANSPQFRGLPASGRESRTTPARLSRLKSTGERHTEGGRNLPNEPVVLPGWVRGALKFSRQEPEKVEATLSNAKVESAVLALGMNILWRDLKRNLPLAARQSVGQSLTEAQQERAARGKKDFWPAFWFANIFMNTIPWTPLIMPFILKVVPEKYVVPAQISVKTEPRLARLVAMKKNELLQGTGGSS